MASDTVPPPPISVNLVIDPPRFAPGNTDNTPTISLTATSHASQPITIFTWPTVFNLKLSQKRTNFTCHNLTSDLPLKLEITKGPKRRVFTRTKDDIDDAFFQTLEPEIPVTFSATFALARRTVDGRYVVAVGHRYRFGIRDGQAVGWWRYGRKEEVMGPPGQPAGLDERSGKPSSSKALFRLSLRWTMATSLCSDKADGSSDRNASFQEGGPAYCLWPWSSVETDFPTRTDLTSKCRWDGFEGLIGPPLSQEAKTLHIAVRGKRKNREGEK